MVLPQLTAHEKHLIAATWDFRASAERSAVKRFGRLFGELKAIDAPQPILNMVQEAVDDELRHIGLCDELAAEFDWQHPPSPPTPHQPLGPDFLSNEDRLLYEMVAFCCLTETINSSMLLAVKSFVQCPRVKTTVHTILKDEINHSKIGWAYLQHARNQRQGDFIEKAIPRMLHEAGIEEIYEPDTGERDTPTMAAYGELSFEMRTDIFRAAMRDIVLPGFKTMQVDIQKAVEWLEQYEPSIGESV